MAADHSVMNLDFQIVLNSISWDKILKTIHSGFGSQSFRFVRNAYSTAFTFPLGCRSSSVLPFLDSANVCHLIFASPTWMRSQLGFLF